MPNCVGLVNQPIQRTAYPRILRHSVPSLYMVTLAVESDGSHRIVTGHSYGDGSPLERPNRVSPRLAVNGLNFGHGSYPSNSKVCLKSLTISLSTPLWLRNTFLASLVLISISCPQITQKCLSWRSTFTDSLQHGKRTTANGSSVSIGGGPGAGKFDFMSILNSPPDDLLSSRSSFLSSGATTTLVATACM